MPDEWERYRKAVQEEDAKRRAQLSAAALQRPVDAGIRAAAAVLMARFQALQPRLRTGGRGDAALFSETRQLLRDHEELRDGDCPPGSRDWEDIQSRCANLMVTLARIAWAQGRPGQANEWFTLAAEGWQALGDRAWVQQCQLEAAEASLADGKDPDVIVAALDSWLDEGAPVYRSRLLGSAARTLVEARDLVGADRLASEAAQTLNAAGFTDPVTAGSVADAFGAWLDSGHRERMPGVPSLQLTAQLNAVAIVWAKLIQVRLRLEIMPREQAVALEQELFALANRLNAEWADIFRGLQPAPGGTVARPAADSEEGIPPAQAAGSSYQQNIERIKRLLVLHTRAEKLSGHSELEEVLADLREVESEAFRASDAFAASYAAIEQADTLFKAHRIAEAAAAVNVARDRLGPGDGLDTARRQTLLVQLYRRAAAAAVIQEQFERLSELCGEGIAESENDRDKVNEPYLQDSYLRDRALLYELGVFAAWKLGDHELAVQRADLAKARGSLGWATWAGDPAGDPAAAPPPAEIAALRSQWSKLAWGQGNGADAVRRRVLWSQLMGARARGRLAAPPRLELRALQATLDPDEAIIFYYFVHSETLLVYVITPTEIAAERRILGEFRDKIDRLADDSADDLKAMEVDWLSQDVRLLSNYLLPGETAHLLADAQRLLICPHRILHQIPLHALAWQQAPLIERFAVSYIPNLTSLLLSRPAPTSTAVLSIGIDSFSPPVPPLRGAEREACQVADLYEQHARSATRLLGAEATRSGLEHLMAADKFRQFAVMHFATHGEDPADEPFEAALDLADGPVDAMNISHWTLGADLVCLAACGSGRRPAYRRLPGQDLPPGSPDPGRPPPGEELFGDEIYGLQAAFFAAGARQVLGTMWPVTDAVARLVMEAFHAGMCSSQRPEIALQAAIRQQISSGRPAFHWAPYKLIVLGRASSGHEHGAS
jgi:CHAT domain-containing protein